MEFMTKFGQTDCPNSSACSHLPRESLLVASELVTKSRAFTCFNRLRDAGWYRASRRAMANPASGECGADDSNHHKCHGRSSCSLTRLCPRRLTQAMETSNPDASLRAKSPASPARQITHNSLWRFLIDRERVEVLCMPRYVN